MSVKYNVTVKHNPMNAAAEKKWYATSKSDGEVTFRELSKEIAQGSTTVSDTDVMAVLNDLIKVLSRHLLKRCTGFYLYVNCIVLYLIF